MIKFAGVIALIFLLSSCHTAAKKPVVENGVLDLTNFNWQKDGIADVSGNWEFYWNRFYQPSLLTDTVNPAIPDYAIVPGFWNDNSGSHTPENNSHRGFGFATYHVKILCPATKEPLALKLLTIESAYRLFVNGKQVASMGIAGNYEESTVPMLKPTIVNVEPENNILDVVIQVSNFQNRVGGIWDFINLGTRDQLQQSLEKNLAIAFIVAGVFLLAFVYNFILYLYFNRRASLLCFALLCLVIFTRVLVTGEMPLNYLFNIDWQILRRAEYISFYFSVPLMSFFSYYLFPKDFYKPVLYFIVPLCSIFIIVSIAGSYYTYTYIVRYYQVIMLLAAFYGFYVYARAAIKLRPGSIFFLTGFILFLATIINDVLYVNLIIVTIPLFYVGLSVFVINLFLVLSRQFAKTFSNLQVANKKLAEANQELALKNNDINEKNEALKKTNLELDSFVHRVSHDLRAPLSSVAGLAEVIVHESNISEIYEYVGMQQKTLIRMDDLIKDIIDFSKNKRLDLHYTEINFADIITNALQDHSHLKNAPSIKTEVQVTQHEKYYSDTRRISTIINNLVSNAIKYSDISKSHPVLFIGVTVMENNATIEVTDNGIGIEENQLEKIFTMFYRATSSSTGSGLGLYIIKETVEKLSGYITISSKKCDGTSIKVVVPDAGYLL